MRNNLESEAICFLSFMRAKGVQVMNDSVVARVDAHNELLKYTLEQRVWAKIAAAYLAQELHIFLKMGGKL